MEQLVRVKAVYENGTAQVLCVRESACSGDCHKCSGCGAAKEAVALTAANPIGARRGDLVRVESASAPVLKAAVVLYIIPLILFFAGYALGSLWGIGPWIAGLGFLLGVGIVIAYDRLVVKKSDLSYTITAFAGESRVEASIREEQSHG